MTLHVSYIWAQNQKPGVYNFAAATIGDPRDRLTTDVVENTGRSLLTQHKADTVVILNIQKLEEPLQ